MNIVIVTQCITLVGIIVGGFWAFKAKAHIQEVHILINSRLSALLLATTEAAYLKGVKSVADTQSVAVDAEELKRTAKIAAEVLIETARQTAEKLVWKK